MKKNILYLLLFVSVPSFCQVNFRTATSWSQLSEMAKKENKLLFLQLYDSKCQECNEVATKGLSETILKEKFDKNFVSAKIDLGTENGKEIGKKFNFPMGVASVFADANGNLLNLFPGSTSAGFRYAEEADIAISRKGTKQLGDFEREYQAGERSLSFLEAYLKKKKEVKLSTADLMDLYVGKLPVDSLNSFRVVKFIYQMGPTIDSRAYTILQNRTYRHLVDSIYKVSPLQERIDINNSIINNSFQKAVLKKDQELAYQVGNFVSHTYAPDFMKGMVAQRRHLTRFFYAIKDTVNYRHHAMEFIEDFHMKITADSLRKMDEKNFEKQHPKQERIGKTVTYNFAPESQFYHLDLNEHAWHFYEMFSTKDDLERALKWSYQSQEFFNELNRDTNHPMKLGNAAYIDTYAQILYKLGRKEEAVQWQTKAVAAQDITGNSSASLQETLKKMKLGTL